MKRLRSFFQGSRGFSLVEMLVVVGIISIIMGTIGTALFQSLKTETGVRADGLAINELRKGLSWFASDVKMAQTSTLVNLDPAVNAVTFTWTDQFQDASVPHTSTYAIVGDELVRTYDTNSHAVARDVVSAEFSLNTRSVLVKVTVNSGAGVTRDLSVNTIMRSVAP